MEHTLTIVIAKGGKVSGKGYLRVIEIRNY